jgi:hypothetical protein
MPYKIYDKKKKKYAFNGEVFSSVKNAKYSIIDSIHGAGNSVGGMKRAVNYLDNYVVRKVVAKKPAKKK